MKIPKFLKLPRKLKKELKKGFVRNVRNSAPVLSDKPGVVSCSMFQTVSYTGSNTKSFRRLCKAVRREEKRMYSSVIESNLKNNLWLWDEEPGPLNLDRFKVFVDTAVKTKESVGVCFHSHGLSGVDLKYKPEMLVGNSIPEFWKDTTIQLKVIPYDKRQFLFEKFGCYAKNTDPILSCSIGLHIKDKE